MSAPILNPSAGTQIVSVIEIRGPNNSLVHPRGAVGIAELIERKTKGENTTLTDADTAFHEAEYHRLRAELQTAHDASTLPETPDDATRQALNDLLVRIRLGTQANESSKRSQA